MQQRIALDILRGCACFPDLFAAFSRNHRLLLPPPQWLDLISEYWSSSGPRLVSLQLSMGHVIWPQGYNSQQCSDGWQPSALMLTGLKPCPVYLTSCSNHYLLTARHLKLNVLRINFLVPLNMATFSSYITWSSWVGHLTLNVTVLGQVIHYQGLCSPGEINAVTEGRLLTK